jgi:3-oxoadipate enol-lactonase
MSELHDRMGSTARGQMAWLEAGAGWPVILIHGFPFRAEMWRPQLEHVPSGARFIAPDLRGFGGTPLGPLSDEPPSMNTYALDVFALMDSLKIDAATIAGFSMGGYVAFAMHRLAPRRFNGIVLADTRSPADTPQGREGRVQMRKALAGKGPSAVSSAMLPKLLSPNADAATVELVRDMIDTAAAPAIDAAIVAMMERPDSTPDLQSIGVPALVLVGSDDVITPVTDAEAMRIGLPRATLTVIPNAGHLANLEQPETFNRVLADHLLAHL